MSIEEIRAQYGLTEVEAKLFAVLQDGKRHGRDELLFKATGREHASYNLIAVHIGRMRPKLAKFDIRIIGHVKSWSGGGWHLVRSRIAA